MRRNGMLLAVLAVLAFVAGMLMAGGPLHAHRDEVTDLDSFRRVSEDSGKTATVGWVVRDGDVYWYRGKIRPVKTPLTCKRQGLVFEQHPGAGGRTGGQTDGARPRLLARLLLRRLLLGGGALQVASREASTAWT